MDKKHVMVVDDDSTMRRLVREWLEGAGYRVTEAANAVEFTMKEYADKPDLVVLDLKMPGISGHRVLRRLKGDDEGGTPVVVLSGSSNPQDRDAAIAAGADSYVAKPASRESFITEVARALGDSA